MKKFAAVLLGIFGLTAYANAIGYMIVDSYANADNGSGPSATTGGRVWLDPDGILAHATLDTNVDINLELLWGTSAGSVSNVLNLDPGSFNSPPSPFWLASQPTGGGSEADQGAGDITGYADGTILDPEGQFYFIPGEPAGATIWVQLVGWTGNSLTPNGPNVQLEGETAPFALTLVAPNNPIAPDTRSMSALVLAPIPEPSLPTLSAVGALGFALRRRARCTRHFKNAPRCAQSQSAVVAPLCRRTPQAVAIR